MKPLRGQRGGAAILLLLAVLTLGGSYYLVSNLNAMSVQRKASEQAQNAEVLRRAKQALIGYVISRAQKGGVTDPEQNPGALPCPEHPWHIGLTTDEGTAGPAVGIPNPGYGTANCSSIGRFPWKTIGTEKLTDRSSEPLWYVVGPTWRKTSTATNTTINSNTVGDISFDGRQVVALIIAPGPAMSVQAYGASCAARNQARSAPAGATLNALDYLECFNSGTLQFSTSVPSTSINDQVIAVTTDDLLPGLEAAIAQRIERDIAPVLKDAYLGTKWNASAGQRTFPFPTQFIDGTTNPTAATYQGTSGTTRGLLPFSYSPACSPAGDARCTSSSFHSWGTPTLTKTAGSGNLWVGNGPDCSVSGALVTCTGYYQNNSLTTRFDDQLGNMGNALRDFPLADHTVRVWTILYDGWGWDSWVEVTGSVALSRQFNSNASLSFRVNNIPLRWAWGTSYGYYYIEAQRPAPSDHTLLDLANTTTGWFVRNEWYRLVYYAIAPNYAPGGTLACTTSTTCLGVTNLTPAGAQRAMLILAGRSVNGTVRPSSTLANYLEGGNSTGSFEKQTVSNATRFNDRFVVVDQN